MKKTILFIISFLIIGISSHAEEGMWLPHLLKKMNIKEMQEMGLQLSAKEIYNTNRSSLKDAIVIFGGGCTGEIISSEGLLLTNMHCGYRYIQGHSTMENDFLKNGFWSKSKDQEIPTPGLSVQFLINIKDVSKQINRKLKNITDEEERDLIIEKESVIIIQEALKGTHYEGRVEQYFGGNEFYLLIYERFTDVRLVGNPPVSISDFGSLTDNWMWPRHKADFALFRVYMSPDGKPAKYSENNIPLKPKHHLPVSIKGINSGDYAMIMGYPGNTDRYMSSFGIKELMNIEHPNRIKIRGKKLDLIKAEMEKDPKVRLQYAAKYKGTSNYWKYSIGQIKGLKRLNVLEEKIKSEEELKNWINKESKRQKEFGTIFNEMQTAYSAKKELTHASQYISEALIRGSEVVGTVRYFNKLEDLLRNSTNNKEAINNETKALKSRFLKIFKDYNLATDQKVTTALISMFLNDIESSFHPESINIITNEYQNDIENFVTELTTNSILSSNEKLNDFLSNPVLETLENDIAFRYSKSVYEKLNHLRNESKPYRKEIQIAQRKFIKAIRFMNPDKKYYPDANFTMRLTYGIVGGYNGMDAVSFNHYTTLKGVMEKEDPNNYEFIVPEKLKQLYEEKDYGDYSHKGKMPVCFITNNDITGGNSGSPVIGANGELIGLAFDGNWEGMSSDIAFEPNMQKTICVDARYLLFIIEKFGGAKNIIDELSIIR